MSIDALEPDEVLALRFDEPALADSIAAWCGGQVERTALSSGEVVVAVWVPTPRGSRCALNGDWVVRRGAEDHTVMDATAFRASHSPA